MDSTSATGIAALRLAKEVFVTEVALALIVGVKQPSVNHILRNAERVPAEWCIAIDRETNRLGKRVSCHQLRPDLWPEEFVPPEDDTAQREPVAAE